MKTVRVLGLLATLVGIVLIASCAWGQGNQASLEGTVLDQSGAVLADVKLTATNTATGIRFVATSDSNVLFAIPSSSMDRKSTTLSRVSPLAGRGRAARPTSSVKTRCRNFR